MAIEFPESAISPPQEVPAGEKPTPPRGRTSRRDRAWEITRALLRSPIFMIGAAILLFWVLDAIFWPLFVPYDPLASTGSTLQGPSGAHWFGTDDLGRDVFSRVLAGATDVMRVAPAATVLGLIGGILIGLITGYYRGLTDDVLMRVVDALLAFPLIIIAMLVLALLGGHSEVNVVIVIGIVFIPIVARTVRSAVLSEREREYVAAAKLLGQPGIVIMVREILPNVMGPVLVEATIRLGYAIFAVATLSFLGLGIGVPSPDWGLTISNARVYVQIAPWMVLFPAGALATLVVALNFVADGLRQVLES